jgi:hypothetical protein
VDISDMTPREKKDYLYEIGRWGTMGNLLGHIAGAGIGASMDPENMWTSGAAGSVIGGLAGGGLGAGYGALRGYQKTSERTPMQDQLFMKLAEAAYRARDLLLPLGGAVAGGLVAGHAEDIPGWIGDAAQGTKSLFGGSADPSAPAPSADGWSIPRAPDIPDLPWREIGGGVVGGATGSLLAQGLRPQHRGNYGRPSN